jgi:hypothetical protein
MNPHEDKVFHLHENLETAQERCKKNWTIYSLTKIKHLAGKSVCIPQKSMLTRSR